MAGVTEIIQETFSNASRTSRGQRSIAYASFEQTNLAFERDLLMQPACSVQILAGSSQPIEAPSITSFATGQQNREYELGVDLMPNFRAIGMGLQEPAGPLLPLLGRFERSEKCVEHQPRVLAWSPGQQGWVTLGQS